MLRCFIVKDNVYLVDSHSLVWQKALKAIHKTDPKLEYFRKKMLEALEAQEKGERLQKAGFPIGTIREWRGKKFIKIAPNKWRPKYDAHTRGAKLAIRAIKRKVDLATSSEELLQITLGNSSRFRDSDGHLLPFVQELRDYISTRNLEIESGKKSNGGNGGGGNGGNGGGEPPIGRVAKLRKELEQKLKRKLKSINSVKNINFTKLNRRLITLGSGTYAKEVQIFCKDRNFVVMRETRPNKIGEYYSVCGTPGQVLKLIKKDKSLTQLAAEREAKDRGDNGGDGGEPPKASKMLSLTDNIEKILNGTQEEKDTLQRTYFKVADTGKILKEAGLIGDSITISYGVISHHKNKDKDHNFTTKQWRQICQKINNPYAITKYKDGYNVYLKAIKDGKDVLIGMSIKNAGKNLNVNAINTVFAKDFSAKDKDVVYIKEKARLAFSGRDQSPSIANQASTSTISHPAGLSSGKE